MTPADGFYSIVRPSQISYVRIWVYVDNTTCITFKWLGVNWSFLISRVFSRGGGKIDMDGMDMGTRSDGYGTWNIET